MYRNLIKQFGRLLALTALLLSFSVVQSVAQTTSSTSPTLSAVLTDVISLTASITSVQIRFQTAGDYNTGVTQTATNQLSVTSNKPYSLQVRASGDLSNGQATPTTIPISSVGLTANWAGGGHRYPNRHHRNGANHSGDGSRHAGTEYFDDVLSDECQRGQLPQARRYVHHHAHLYGHPKLIVLLPPAPSGMERALSGNL